MTKIRGFATAAAVIVMAVFLPANAALARNNVAWNQLSAAWWQWVLSIPPSVNPLLDTTGDDCMVGQHGTTWFLAGSWVAGPITRDCDIPQGVTLFFPVINQINFDTPGQCGQGAPLPSGFYRALSAAFVNGATNLSATLDGLAVKPPMHRTVSQVFEVALPDDNIFVGVCSPDLTGGIYSPAVDDGFYVRLNPLAVGPHTLHIHAENPTPPGFVLDITYNLEVVPVATQ
jgi:hypothetical protein